MTAPTTRRDVVADVLPGTPLTPRELAILRLVARGLPNAKIGAALYLHRDTVKTHVRRIMRRLDAVDRTNAVAIAYERGILVGGSR